MCEIDFISPFFETGRVESILSGKDERIRAATAEHNVVPDAACERVVTIGLTFSDPRKTVS